MQVVGRVECDGWGDVRGFRYQGELVEFTTHLRLIGLGGGQSVGVDAQSVVQGRRDGDRQTYIGTLAVTGSGMTDGETDGAGAVGFRIEIADAMDGVARFDIEASSSVLIPVQSVSYLFNLPAADYFGGTVELVLSDGTVKEFVLDALVAAGAEMAEAAVMSVRLSGAGRRFELAFTQPTRMVMQDVRPGGGGDGRIVLSFPVGGGALRPGGPFHIAFELKVWCELDVAPVTVALDATRTGPGFAGMGGNFRLQSAEDAAHIAYNLEHLRIAWARIALPLDQWQTSENADPLREAEAGRLHENVRASMELAGVLARKKIPLIISDWPAPEWAREPGSGTQWAGGGVGAYRIAADKWPAMYRGIGSYLLYMKKHYGAEPVLFSFNEADLGIDVKLSPEEQRVLLRELGPYLAAQGLKTRMLLGDTAGPIPRPEDFMEPAINDLEAMKWVGAVSYHSWHGGSDAVLLWWGELAQRLKLPLFVGEGGSDPSAWRFPHVIQEPWYALEEMEVYLRCVRFSRPVSILHWQLTENYGILSGGQEGQPLAPAQRFYHFQQLNLTPADAPALGVSVDRPRITAAAYGDLVHGVAIHLINTGATRKVTVTGLPLGLRRLSGVVTGAGHRMRRLDPIVVTNGSAEITLEFQSYVTLTGAGNEV